MINITNKIKRISDSGLWYIHGYYTLCPYAPDGSGRLVAAAADLLTGKARVHVLSRDGVVLHSFGENECEASFYHTGFWQTWSPDSRFVYYQSGSMEKPFVVKHELATGAESRMEGDMEGAPPFGEPIISGLLGMLYAAGYGDGNYYHDQAPVPFEQRTKHGLFRYCFNPDVSELVLTVEDMLQLHPDRKNLLEADAALQLHGLGGLTLMCYCVRWNADGDRCLFYFGNHCVDGKRGEPRLSYVFTADRDFKQIHLAVDLSFGKRGVHWSWHPDGQHLIGYGPDPDAPGKMCLAQVLYDGSDYRKISRHASGGHPSISPADHNILVTDEFAVPNGRIVLIDLRSDTELRAFTLPCAYGNNIPKGRNPYRVCFHPVFDRSGEKLLVNTLPGRNAVLCEIKL